MNKLLEQIKLNDKPDMISADVPEWGGVKVYIKQLTVGERDSFEVEAIQSKGSGLMSDIRSKFLVRVLCDETGQPVASDYKELRTLSSKPCERLFELAQKHNKLTDDDVEDLAKN